MKLKEIFQNGFFLMSVGIVLFYFVGSLGTCNITGLSSLISFIPCMLAKGLMSLVVKLSGVLIFVAGVRRLLK